MIIDIGAKERVAGLAYVTTSRGGKLSDLMIESATLDRLNAVKKNSTSSRRGKKA